MFPYTPSLFSRSLKPVFLILSTSCLLQEWVTWSAKDENELHEQGDNFTLVWNAIPAWMGLKKPKFAAEKYNPNPLILRPVIKAPLNIESAGACTGRDTAADRTSRSPSPRSPLAFQQAKEKEGNQEKHKPSTTECTMLSGLAETRTTYSLTTSVCFHYPDFDIPHTKQSKHPQMYQEFQEDTLNIEESSPRARENHADTEFAAMTTACPIEEDSPGTRENHVDTEFAVMTTASPVEEDTGKVSSEARENHVDTEFAVTTTASPIEEDTGKDSSGVRGNHADTEIVVTTTASPIEEDSSGARENYVDTEFAAMATASPVEEDIGKASGKRENHVVTAMTIASAVEVDTGKISSMKREEHVNTEYSDVTTDFPLTAELTQAQVGKEICTTPRGENVNTEYPGTTIVSSVATDTNFEQISQGAAREKHENNELSRITSVVGADTNSSSHEKPSADQVNTKSIGAAAKQRETPWHACSGDEITSGKGQTSVASCNTKNEGGNEASPQTILAPPEACASSASPAQPIPDVEISPDASMMNPEFSKPFVVRQKASLVANVLADEETDNSRSARPDVRASSSTLKDIVSVSPSGTRSLVVTPMVEVLDVNGTKNATKATDKVTPTSSSMKVTPARMLMVEESGTLHANDISTVGQCHAKSTTTGSKSGFVPSKVTSHNETAKGALTKHLPVTVKRRLNKGKIADVHVKARNMTSEKRKRVANTTVIEAEHVTRDIARSRRPNMTAINRGVTTMAVSQQRRLRSRGVPLQIGNFAPTAQTSHSVPLVTKRAITQKQSGLRPKHAAVTGKNATASTLVSTRQTKAELNSRTSEANISHEAAGHLVTKCRRNEDPRLRADRNSIYIRNSLKTNSTTDAVTVDLGRRGPHQSTRDSLLRGSTLSGMTSGHGCTWNITALTRSDGDSKAVSTKRPNTDSVLRSAALEPASKRSASSTLSNSMMTERQKCEEFGAGRSYPPQRSYMRRGPVGRSENRPSVSAPSYQPSMSSVTTARYPSKGKFAESTSTEKGKGRQDTDMNVQNAPRQRDEYFGSEMRTSVSPVQLVSETTTRRKSGASETMWRVSASFTGATKEGHCDPGEMSDRKDTRKADSNPIGTGKSVDITRLSSESTSLRGPSPISPPPPPPPVYHQTTCQAAVTTGHAVAYGPDTTLTKTQIYYYPFVGQQFGSMSLAPSISGLIQANEAPLDPSANVQYQGAAWGYPQRTAVSGRNDTYLPLRDFSVPGFYPPYGASQLYPYMGSHRSHMRQESVGMYENRPSLSAPPYQHPLVPNSQHTGSLHPSEQYGPYDPVSAGFGWR